MVKVRLCAVTPPEAIVTVLVELVGATEKAASLSVPVVGQRTLLLPSHQFVVVVSHAPLLLDGFGAVVEFPSHVRDAAWVM